MEKNKIFLLKEKFDELPRKFPKMEVIELCSSETGITKSTIWRDIKGKAEDKIPYMRILKYAKFLNCKPEDLQNFSFNEIEVRNIQEATKSPDIKKKFNLTKTLTKIAL